MTCWLDATLPHSGAMTGYVTLVEYMTSRRIPNIRNMPCLSVSLSTANPTCPVLELITGLHETPLVSDRPSLAWIARIITNR